MLRRTSVSIATVAILVGAITGCSTATPTSPTTPLPEADQSIPLADLDLLEDPHSFVGESTAVLADTAIPTVASKPTPVLPVTVTSRDLAGDVEVTVKSDDRILAMDLSGSIAATVFGLGLGENVVGRDISTTFAAASELPVITSSGHSINSESILALRPTVLITDGSIGPIDVVLQLRDAGIPVVFVETDPSLAGIEELTHQVADALGVTSAGDELAATIVASIDAKVAEIAGILPNKPLRILFLYLRGSSGIYYLFGKESGADALIAGLGGVDVAAEVGLVGDRPMTDEAFIAANPDLVLVMTDGLASVGGVDGLLESKPAIALTKAGQNRRFVDMADGEVLSFGPRTPAVLDALARAIYAPKR
jgi:iron complex transport system substrate-binding protein